MHGFWQQGGHEFNMNVDVSLRCSRAGDNVTSGLVPFVITVSTAGGAAAGGSRLASRWHAGSAGAEAVLRRGGRGRRSVVCFASSARFPVVCNPLSASYRLLSVILRSFMCGDF